MKPKHNELTFFVAVLATALLWLPVAAWLMPRIALAPSYEANPLWYWTSAGMGVVMAYGLRWAAKRIATGKLGAAK